MEAFSNPLLDRRSFVERLAGVAALASVARASTTSQTTPGVPAGTLNGIQMGPHTILDEGIERTLDVIGETAAINAVMPYSHAYNAALVKPLRDRADHGVPLTDNAGRRFPLLWVRSHDQYYKDTTLRHEVVTSSHEHFKRDLFAERRTATSSRSSRITTCCRRAFATGICRGSRSRFLGSCPSRPRSAFTTI